MTYHESFRRECCDRCGEWNDSSDVTMIEHSDGSGELVCSPCMNDEKRHYEQDLFDSYADEI